jgi:broad specificity phosphatase PhoE
VYFSLLVGGESDLATFNQVVEQAARGEIDPQAVCAERLVNRQRYQYDDIRANLANPQHAAAHLLRRWQRLLAVRREIASFHPDAPQQVLTTPALPSLLVILRGPAAGEYLLGVYNFAPVAVLLPATVLVQLLAGRAPLLAGCFRDHLAPETRALLDWRGGIDLAPYQARWLAMPNFASLPPPLLDSLRATSPFAHFWEGAATMGPAANWPRAVSSCSPAVLLRIAPDTVLRGFRLQHYKDLAGAPAAASTGASRHRVLHLIRHGEAFHQQVKRLRSYKPVTCPCYAKSADAQGLPCPFIDPLCFDSFLTPAGVTAIGKITLPPQAQQVLVACDTRCLQTARLLVAAAGARPQPLPIHASELLRPLINPHAHARRSGLDVLQQLFPEIAVWGPPTGVSAAEGDPLFDAVRGGGLQSESRDSLELRIRAFLTQVWEGPAEDVVVVGHLSWFMTLFVSGEVDDPLLGDRSDPHDRSSLCDFPQREEAIHWLLHSREGGILSLVLTLDAPH